MPNSGLRSSQLQDATPQNENHTPLHHRGPDRLHAAMGPARPRRRTDLPAAERGLVCAGDDDADSDDAIDDDPARPADPDWPDAIDDADLYADPAATGGHSAIQLWLKLRRISIRKL